MKHFYLIVNQDKDPDGRTAAEVQRCIVENGGTCITGDKNKKGKVCYTDADSIPKETEGILVIGGDGTLIQAARDLKENTIPILGINRGNLGFLSEVEAAAVETTIKKLIRGEYYVEERMLLHGELIRDGQIIHEDSAWNDIILSRRGNLRILRYRIEVNDEFLCEYEADGIIIATPTGSTAYNLSAGGPIVSPEASLFVVTPICAHSLNARSIILPEDSRICIIAEDGHDSGEGWIGAFDGVSCGTIQSGDRLCISKAQKKVSLIKLSKVSFLETLRKKMQN